MDLMALRFIGTSQGSLCKVLIPFSGQCGKVLLSILLFSCASPLGGGGAEWYYTCLCVATHMYNNVFFGFGPSVILCPPVRTITTYCMRVCEIMRFDFGKNPFTWMLTPRDLLSG